MARRYKSFSGQSGFKQYWNLFLCPPPYDTTSVHLSADQYGAMLIFPWFRLTNILNHLIELPCINQHFDNKELRHLLLDQLSLCRSNWVMNFDIWKQQGSLDLFTSMSIHFLCPIGIKVPIACWWRFRLCSGFLRSCLFLLLGSALPRWRTFQHLSQF